MLLMKFEPPTLTILANGLRRSQEFPEKDISSRIPTRPILFAPRIDEDHAGTIEILNIPCDHR